MSKTVTFNELVDLAIGTPELGNVNFNALHFLLRSMLEYLKILDMEKIVSDDELAFLKPRPRSSSATGLSEQLSNPKRTSSFFHQMQDRIANIERKISFLNETPTATELLSRTQTFMGATPAQDMWQMMQLKKKMELNEEGMTKAMTTLQDLLSNICALKNNTENLKEDVGLMKDDFQKLDVEKLQKELGKLDDHTKTMEELKEHMSIVKSAMGPELSDLVQWSTLGQMLLGQAFAEMRKEDRDKLCQELLSALGLLPEKHDQLIAQLTDVDERLKAQAARLDRWDWTVEPEAQVASILQRLDYLEKQDQCSLRGVLDQVSKMKEQYENLEVVVDRLKKNATEIENIHNSLEHLDITKADKALIEEEMRVKADKSALDAMVNHVDLALATNQLTEMMQDMLQKVSLQDQDWQQVLQKLFTDMDLKLDRMALDPLNKELEEVWQVIKKYLSEGPSFDADSAAGFKKQLFERVKCISCDRPVTMMTGPHLLTVRKFPLRPRPASANGYEYLAEKQRDLEAAFRDQEVSFREPVATEGTGTQGGNQPPSTCWQCQAQQTCTIKRLSRSQDFATLYPYGDPSVLTYDNAEVDILGINGVLYKGRVNSQTADRVLTMQKKFTAVGGVPIPPRPPPGIRMERARSAIGADYVSPSSSSTAQRIRSSTGSNRLVSSAISETMDGMVRRSSSASQNGLPNGGGVKGI